jgi:hypothetical protein
MSIFAPETKEPGPVQISSMYASLLEILFHFKGRSFEDQRDVVFAALSFTKAVTKGRANDVDWMLPNYLDSVEKMFTDVFLLMLRNSNDLMALDLLEKIDNPLNSMELPSWVPNFCIFFMACHR